MRFKKLRYNLIMFGLVAIVGCSVAIPLTSTPIIDGNHGMVDPETPEIPDVPGIEGEDKDDPNYEEDKFLLTGDFDLINYSINMLYNGNGFNAVFNQTLMNNATVMGQTIPALQSAVGNLKKNKTHSLEEAFYYADVPPIGGDQVKNHYEYKYIDNINQTFQKGNSKTGDANGSNYDYKNKTYNLTGGDFENLTLDQAYDKHCVLVGDSYTVQTNVKTVFSKGVVETIEDEKFGKYRSIEINYDVSKLPARVLQNFGSTGQLTNIKYDSPYGYKVIYKINLNTGKMISLTRVEAFTGYNPQYKASMQSKATTTYTFLSVDREQEIVCPK